MVSKTVAALLASGLVASVNAVNNHAHHTFLHKKAVEASSEACGCHTYTTTWYGEPTLVWAPPPSTSSSSSSSSSSSTSTSSTSTSTSTSSTWTSSSEVHTTSTSTPPPPPPPTTTSSWVAPTTTAAAITADSWGSSGSSSSNSNNGGLGGLLGNVGSAVGSAVGAVASAAASITSNGSKWAMTYTPYNNDGTCKSADQVTADIQVIAGKGFASVRIYATDCSGLINVGAAVKASGLKLIAGVFIDNSGLGPAYEQVSTINSWGSQGNWDHVEMIVIGNEAIFNGYTDAGSLAGLINSARSTFRSSGYSGPVTTTDTVNSIQSNGATLCPAVDVIAANIHPFFNGGVAALGAGAFVQSQLSLLSNVCGGSKPAYNLETGWPSQGSSNGDAIPGVSDQKIAIESIAAAAGSKSVFFSFADDFWKAPGPLGIEQYWGCSNLF